MSHSTDDLLAGAIARIAMIGLVGIIFELKAFEDDALRREDLLK